jgi:hypothetical protein
MSGHVARIEWSGIDLVSGESEEGVRWVRLDEIAISRFETTRGQRRKSEWLRTRTGDNRPSREESEAIHREIANDPASREVVEVWFKKSCPLSNFYYFGYAEHPVHDPLPGFGLTGGINPALLPEGENDRTFSWDWFDVKEPGKALKLQESGSLCFERATTACGHEIVRMVFETDLSLRVVQRGSARGREPRWRIRIHQGSEIFWPSLVEGEVLANGYVERASPT